MRDIADKSWVENDDKNVEQQPNGWPGNMPAFIDSTGRMMMGAIKRFWRRVNPYYLTTGTDDNYLVSPDFSTKSLNLFEILRVRVHAVNTTTTPTLKFGKNDAKIIAKITAAGIVPLELGDLVPGKDHSFWFDGTRYILSDPEIVSATSVSGLGTAAFANASSFQSHATNLDTLAAVTPGTAGTTVLASALSGDIRNYLDTAPYAANRTILKALDPTRDLSVLLQEAGRAGIFNWVTGDFTASLAADPLEGVYIKANGVASTVGAWVRQDGGWLFGDMRAEWFGAIEGVTPANASTNRAAIQAAINLRYYLRGGVVKLKGFFYIDDFLAIPSSVVLEGDIRHSVLREFGDTTGGVAHPNTGTVIFTSGAGTARLWTDESNTGSDTPIRVAIAILGENAGVKNLTLQTPLDSTAWDVGIQLCGVSRGVYEGLDVRGAWKQDAIRFDATWGPTNTILMATAFLPSWFDSNYKTIYDYGLTNNYLGKSRFEGARAFTVESGPNNAFATNGISDTVVIGCEFYNDASATTLAFRTGVNGALIRLNYRLPSLGGAQGLMFVGCRFDVASRWAFDFNWWSNVDLVQRCFAETSGVYQTYQVGQGVPVEQQRGRIRTTTNTTSNTGDVLRFCGEFFCNVSSRNTPGADNGDNVTPITWNPLGQSGRRLTFETGAFQRTMDIISDGEVGATGHIIRSARSHGLISLQNTNAASINTWGYLADNENSWGTAYDQKWGLGTVTFQRNLLPFLSFDSVDIKLPTLSTAANSANVYYDLSTGKLQLSTSSEDTKYQIEDADFELSKAVVLGSQPKWYRHKSAPSNYSYWGFIAEQVVKIDPRMVTTQDGETIYHRFVDVIWDDTVMHSWPAKYEDDDETSPLLIEVSADHWIALDQADDPFIHLEMGYYRPRAEAEFVKFDKPKPSGVNYGMYAPHHNAMICKLWDMAQTMSDRLTALEGSPKA